MNKTKLNFSIFPSSLFFGIATVFLGWCAHTDLAFAETGSIQSYGQQSSFENENRLGLGAMLGVPTGLCAKYRLTSGSSVDFGLAFSFNNYIEVFSDYLYQFPGAFSRESATSAEFTPYIGVGAVIFSNTAGVNAPDSHYFSSNNANADLGVRFPLGIEWLPRRVHLGVFGELVPGIGIVPGTFAFIEGDVGVRYYL